MIKKKYITPAVRAISIPNTAILSGSDDDINRVGFRRDRFADPDEEIL